MLTGMTVNLSAESVTADEVGLVLSCPQCGRRNRIAYDKLSQAFRCGNCKGDLAAPEAPIDVHTEQIFEAITTRSGLPVLVDFWASWCGPCKMVAPELVKIAQEGAGRWLVIKLSTEEVPAVAQHQGISAIPTLALFAGGREIARQAGAMPASDIRQFISEALK
jgi:thioredoxin 2